MSSPRKRKYDDALAKYNENKKIADEKLLEESKRQALEQNKHILAKLRTKIDEVIPPIELTKVASSPATAASSSSVSAVQTNSLSPPQSFTLFELMSGRSRKQPELDKSPKKSRIDKIDTLVQAKSKIKTLEDANEDLERKLQASKNMNVTSDKFSDYLKQARSDLETLKATLALRDETIDRLNKTITEKYRAVQAVINEQLNQYKARVNDLEIDIQGLKNDAEEDADEIELLNNRIAELEKQRAVQSKPSESAAATLASNASSASSIKSGSAASSSSVSSQSFLKAQKQSPNISSSSTTVATKSKLNFE